jgi:peroxiredoxin family protein
MDACRALEKPGADGQPAWRSMPARRGMNIGLMQGGAMDDDFQKKGIATFEELLTACPTLGVKIMVCEMGLKARGLTRESLRRDIPVEAGGVVTFLNDASRTGALVFV